MTKSNEQTYTARATAKRGIMRFRDRNPALTHVSVEVVETKKGFVVHASGWTNGDVAAIDAAGFIRVEDDQAPSPGAQLIKGLAAREAIADEDFAEGVREPTLADLANGLVFDDAKTATEVAEKLGAKGFSVDVVPDGWVVHVKDTPVAEMATDLIAPVEGETQTGGTFRTAGDALKYAEKDKLKDYRIAQTGGGNYVVMMMDTKAKKTADRKAAAVAAAAKRQAKSDAKAAAVAQGKADRKAAAEAKAAGKTERKAKAKVIDPTAKGDLRPDGLRIGTAAARMVDAALRPEGATYQDLLDASGWAACRPAFLTACAKAGVKLVFDREQKPSRYFATRP